MDCVWKRTDIFVMDNGIMMDVLLRRHIANNSFTRSTSM